MRDFDLSKIKISKIREEEIEENLKLLNLVIKETYFLANRRTITEEQAEQFFYYWVSSGLAIYLVAKYGMGEEEKIVGHISVRPREEDRLEHIGNIGYLVHPDFRKLGIGTLLIKKSIELAAEKGFEILIAEVSHDNTTSISIFKKFGFKKFGRLENALKVEENDYRDIIMFSKSIKNSKK
jgi:ribosomal protein S18 acetylase RimI-like enzyme